MAYTYLPVALNLDGRSAVVVGGGEPAYFKARALVDFEIETTVVAPPDLDFDPRLHELTDDGRITLVRQAYADRHLNLHWIAIIGTGDLELDRRVERDARTRRMPVNVIDVPERSDFFATAYVRHGDVSLAVSTGGASPAFAAALKGRVAESFGPEIQEHLAHYVQWRELVRSRIDDPADRERLWRSLRADGLDRVLQRDGPDAARKLIESHLADAS